MRSVFLSSILFALPLYSLSISADFLAWYPSQEVASIWADVISLESDGSTWNAPTFKWKWDYGVRLGVGEELCYDQWDTFVYWTYFQTGTTHKIPPQPNTRIGPEFFAAFLSGDVPQSMQGRWTLLLNALDWELGRSCQIGCFLLRPFLGIKSAWVDQSIRVHYDLSAPNSGLERLKNKFFGIGPLWGLQSKWCIECFSLFGDVSMAALWGNWVCQDRYKNSLGNENAVNTRPSQLGALMFRGFVGMGWEFGRFSARLGYEMQLWMDQLRIATFQLQRLHDDLTLQGVTFSLGVEF